MSTSANTVQVNLRPFHQRFARSYRAWRASGLPRMQALSAAWRISRILSKVC